MDDGRETFVQSYVFLILACYSFENYPLSIRQSILNIISKILQSFSEEIYQFNWGIKPFHTSPLSHF